MASQTPSKDGSGCKFDNGGGVTEGGAHEKMGRVRRKHIYSKTLNGDVWRHGRVMGR